MSKLVVPILLVLLSALFGPAAFAADLDSCGTLTVGIPGTPCSEIFLHVESAGYFLLDNYADFVAGDFVHVVGSFPASCWVSCPDASGCLNVETIALCAPTSTQVHSWGVIKSLYR